VGEFLSLFQNGEAIIIQRLYSGSDLFLEVGCISEVVDEHGSLLLEHCCCLSRSGGALSIKTFCYLLTSITGSA